MNSAAQLRISLQGGGWQVTVTDGGTRPVEGRVPPEGWQALRETLTRIDATAGPRVLIPGRDVALTRLEDDRGRALSHALAEATAAWGHLQVLRGRIEGGGQPLTLAIDVSDPELRALPWELVVLGEGGLEPVHGGLVVRMASGPGAPPAPHPTVAFVVPSHDPEAHRLLAAARGHAADAGLTEVALEARPAVIHVLAHGHRASGAVAIALEDGAHSAGTMAARLGEALADAHLIVLSVCHGGSEAPQALDGLAGRLVASGAALVLAPRRATGVAAADRIAAGLYSALGAGESVGRAIVAARRHLRGWGHPHPSHRWWAWSCWAARLDTLDGSLVPRTWIPEGWPPPSPAAGAWLEAARQDADRRADGYVGLEHLLRALDTTDGGGDEAAAVRRAARRALSLWDEVGLALSPQRPPPDPLRPTPRLSDWAPRLRPQFDIEALSGIIAQSQLLPDLAAPMPGVETLFTEDGTGDGPCRTLQILAGPEDGRMIRLAKGDLIGRAGGTAHHLLFVATRFWDRRLSRTHCRWDGDGRITLFKPGFLLRRDGRHRVEGPVDLRVGDVLILSEGTRLRALGAA